MQDPPCRIIATARTTFRPNL